MPAMLDDPDTATIYRVSGQEPFPDPAHPSLPASITPRQVTLRDRQTVATVVPFASRFQVPDSLLRYLNDQFNKEIEGGDTYPLMEGLPFEKFASYWFQNFGAIMLLGSIESADEVVDGKDWSKECLGTFYIKPNYPGRSSHVCNAGFIVTDASRNRGVGRLMGETYLDWAPKLGYTYSVFNLVYETNVASCKIWDALGFKRIGRVKDCGNLKSYPGKLIDAIIYGRDLGGDSGADDPVSEERFDKIKFYLKYGRYPSGADRAEKSRLRSAATHYKLLDGDVLMLKDKEVISDPNRQYDIARGVHNQTHAGINKTTATIAERYHWSRIKETVSDVIRNCFECKELGKTSAAQSAPVSVTQPRAARSNLAPSASTYKRKSPSPSAGLLNPRARGRSIPLPDSLSSYALSPHHYDTEMGIITPSHTLSVDSLPPSHHTDSNGNSNNPMLQDQPHDVLRQQHASSLPDSHHTLSAYHPIDPAIINQPSPHLHSHPLHHQLHTYTFSQQDDDHDHDRDASTFEALLNATDVDTVSVLSHHDHHDHDHHSHLPRHPHHAHHASISHPANPAHDILHETLGLAPHHRSQEEEDAAVDRDLEMLIEQGDDEDGTGQGGVGSAGGMDVDGPIELDGGLDGDRERGMGDMDRRGG